MCDNVHEFGFKFDGTRPKKPWTSESEEKKDNYLKQMEIFHREKQAEWEAFVAGLKTKFWSDRCGWGEFRIIFEIKPTIQSFGRVLRQLKLYKSRARDSDIVLITNDKRYDAPFKSQDITVVHPEEFGIESWEG